MVFTDQVLPPIARHFSSLMAAYAGDSRHLKDIAAILSARVETGDICISLSELSDSVVVLGGCEMRLPDFADLVSDLAQSPAVGKPGERTPLVLDDKGRLYLYRYWQYEQAVARFLTQGQAVTVCADKVKLADALSRLFPESTGGVDWQRAAALAAATGRVTIISGGPGTGKTTTVVKILGLLLEQDAALKIALCAPTGKAAARLTDSIRLARGKLPCTEEVRNAIPEEVATIHRLLGAMPNSVRFRHGAGNPLSHDVVVVDEASMVSLPLFAKLLTALKPATRLILLGDRDQLASVEAGAVLGDIAGPLPEPAFSAEFAELAAQVSGETIQTATAGKYPLQDRVVLLRTNYRFKDDSGIAAACRAVNAGDGEAVIEGIATNRWNDVGWLELPAVGQLNEQLAPAIIAGFRDYLAASTPEEALLIFDNFRVLCALRNGYYGVGGMNRLVVQVLAEKDLIKPEQQWYHGRPVMITSNDYGLRLFNGDIGLALSDPEDRMLRVFFRSSDGSLRKFTPLQLPGHETAFAMTVHKSQGSEFEKILFILPDQDVQVLTRELIYTGISRARKEAVLVGTPEVFRQGVARRVVRQGGLGDMLWEGRNGKA